MSELVRITDVSPRDGLQNEPGIIPTAEKVRLIELLCATGVDEIEVTSFVSPKWVPQLADAGEVLNSPSLREGAGGRAAKLVPPARNPVTVERAKALRPGATVPEKLLWAQLSAKQLAGYKFRRQHPFGPYILDFYCASPQLVVELDGRTHDSVEAKSHDRERTEYLERHGLRVLRFRDDDVLGDAEGVVHAILTALRDCKAAPFPPPPPSGRGSRAPAFSVLVPNERGFQSVLDINRSAHASLVSKVSVFTAASETFTQKNTNASIAETIERFRPIMSGANAQDLQTRGYISCAIACPFEGPIAPDRVVDVASRLIDLGVTEIDLGDTIGAGTPETTRALLETYAKRWPIRGARVPLTLHLHDTFGRAADCVRAALDLGVRSFDGSVAGLGGCPYATTKLPDGSLQRAPGNISTETLVKTIHAAGYETGVDLDALERAAEYARAIVARSRASAAAAGKPDAGGGS